MKKYLNGIMIACGAFASITAHAQPSNGYGNHMWGWGGSMFGMPFGSLLWLGLIVLVVVLLWRSLSRRDSSSDISSDKEALTLLKKRYARGEIDDAEYDRMRSKLMDDSGG